MANTIVGPGDGPANVSRRMFISAAALVPIALPLPAQPPSPEAITAFRQALAHYKSADKQYRAHLDGVYFGSWDAFRAGKITRADHDQIEARSDALGSRVSQAAQALLTCPAPDISAFKTKMAIAGDEFFSHEEQFAAIFEQLFWDAHRLLRS